MVENKNFIKIGQTYIDLSLLVTLRFIADKKGYIKMFLYFVSRDVPVMVKIRNKNELSELFLQLDAYLDSTLKDSLTRLIDEVDNLKHKNKE